jgi:hypothetical protein
LPRIPRRLSLQHKEDRTTWFRWSLVLIAAALIPALAHAQTLTPTPKVLRFVPQTNLGVFDQIRTTAYVTRNHGEAYAFLPYVPVGRFFQPTAIRKSVTGVIKGPIFFWNVDKAG